MIKKFSILILIFLMSTPLVFGYLIQRMDVHSDEAIGYVNLMEGWELEEEEDCFVPGQPYLVGDTFRYQGVLFIVNVGFVTPNPMPPGWIEANPWTVRVIQLEWVPTFHFRQGAVVTYQGQWFFSRASNLVNVRPNPAFTGGVYQGWVPIDPFTDLSVFGTITCRLTGNVYTNFVTTTAIALASRTP